jgi:hypothetical protein
MISRAWGDGDGRAVISHQGIHLAAWRNLSDEPWGLQSSQPQPVQCPLAEGEAADSFLQKSGKSSLGQVTVTDEVINHPGCELRSLVGDAAVR